MAKQTLNRQSISEVREELKLLRSFVVGMTGKDREGEYKPEFIKKILRVSRKKAGHIFKGKKSFLANLRKKL